MNLISETQRIVKNVDDIEYINLPKTIGDGYWNESSDWATVNWEFFKEWAQQFSDYDNGYGGAEVPEISIVMKDGTWLSRGEYDGSEWWEWNKKPERIEK